MTRESSTGISKGYVSQPHSHRTVRSLPCPKANILINHKSQACLADFSLLTIVSDQSTVISSCIEGGSIPWMSPELLDPAKFGLVESRPTKESDCYALGMVIYEVLSGRMPFAPNTPPAIMRMVLEGKYPERPQGKEGKRLTDAIWGVLELCWKSLPNDRIGAKAILRGLEGNPPPSRPTFNAGGDLETAGDSSICLRFIVGLSRIILVVCQASGLRAHAEGVLGGSMRCWNRFVRCGDVFAGCGDGFAGCVDKLVRWRTAPRIHPLSSRSRADLGKPDVLRWVNQIGVWTSDWPHIAGKMHPTLKVILSKQFHHTMASSRFTHKRAVRRRGS